MNYWQLILAPFEHVANALQPSMASRSTTGSCQFPVLLANPAAAGAAAAAAALVTVAITAALLRGFVKAAALTFGLHSSGDKLPRFPRPFGITTFVYCVGTIVIVALYAAMFLGLESPDGREPSGFWVFAAAFGLGSLLETLVLVFIMRCPTGLAVLANGADLFWVVLLFLVGW